MHPNKNEAYGEEIVITGIGVVSSIGIGKEAFWQGLRESQSGFKPITLFDTSSTKSKLAGEISDFSPEAILGPTGLRNMDRVTKLALCAAKLCLDDAKFEITEKNAEDTGVVLGTTMGSVASISDFDRQALKEGPRSVNPALFANTVINSPASQISIRFNIRGFNSTISTGFSSAFDAIKYAADFIRWGRAKAVLVGAAEELCEQYFKGFYKLGILSYAENGKEEALRPFDKKRNGTILGEGAAVFLIESLKEAQERGAHVYGIIKAQAASFDRKSMNRYNLRATSEIESIQKVLTLADMQAKDVDCIVSSANATIKGDLSESYAIKTVFDGFTPPVTACKSLFGEAFSASGALQLAAALFVFESQEIPCVAEKSRAKPIKNILITSFGASGQSSSLILEKISA